MQNRPDVLLAGAGIGGLTLALQLHRAGIPCRVLEAAPQLAPLGVGINILPHAARELHRLGLGPALDAAGVRTRESVFYNRFGQLIYAEPAGTSAGYGWPQYSIHRGDLQLLLADAVRDRLGPDAIALGHRLTGFEQDGHGVTAAVETPAGTTRTRADVLIGCDGVHSVVRKQLHPGEEGLRYSGYTMWRGTTLSEPFLSGASMVRAGWLATGKMVVYPIRDNVDGSGRQLVNWVAELETPQRSDRDWNREGALDDVLAPFAGWRFDWLDVPELIRGADRVLEYPMVDQEPLERWSFGRVTLLGDAAHPMVPRGSNGAGQAILDTRALTDRLVEIDDPVRALAAYDTERREATGEVVRLNRTNPPDAILREVYERTGDQPFDRIEDVISTDDLAAVLNRYRDVAGYSHEALRAR
ncbi:flavin-dependent oxidoreductase [Amycolatopsis sp. NPDC051903]|uniref:flavin-dependent oxidoreductase n=1 Tax=Amycolatopsis sp. NPDC051903 TaxID=3363936 RepID=UPI0037BAB2E1